MRTDRSLTLLAPNIGRDLTLARASAAARWPVLARMAGRGRTTSGPASLDPSASVLSALGLESTAYAEAAVMAAGAGLEPRGYWLRATPMHFAAGLNDLRAVPLDIGQRMSHEEAVALGSPLQTVLDAAGLTMHPDGQGGWLLRSERGIDASMSSPLAAASALDSAMPRGSDAALLKRLMTEIQMVLHEHPVNSARARRSQPEINAIWLHGGGMVGDIESRSLPVAYGDDPFLRGVYALHGAAAPERTRDVAQLLEGGKHAGALAILDAATLDELESQWLAPLLAALRSGALASLDLRLDRWRISLERGDMLRFWRAASHPAQWPA